MSKNAVIQYTCDRCFSRVLEADHLSTGSTVTIASPKDKRKSKSYDLCADCSDKLSNEFLTAVTLPDLTKQQ